MDPTHEWLRAAIVRKKGQVKDHDEKINGYKEDITKHEEGKLELTQEIGVMQGYVEVLGFVEEE